MVRFKFCCTFDKDEINLLAAISNTLSACLIVGAIFGEWLLLEDKSSDGVSRNVHYFHGASRTHHLNEELAISNCTSIGSQLFLLPARFSMINRNGTNHILYHYDNLVFMDCVTPSIADYFYLITAFCFVSMSVSVFATILHSTTPPFPFFVYLRLINALELAVCVIISLILLLTAVAKHQVEELQRYAEENREVRSGLSVFMIMAAGTSTISAAVVSQVRQRKIRSNRRKENTRLMCNRPLRSRNLPPSEHDPQPIAELERYLLEPGLRPQCLSSDTLSTICVEDDGLPTNRQESHSEPDE